jgi:hypothetical protein
MVAVRGFQYTIEVLDRAEYDRLNEQIAELDEVYGQSSDLQKQAEWLAARAPLVAAARALVRRGCFTPPAAPAPVVLDHLPIPAVPALRAKAALWAAPARTALMALAAMWTLAVIHPRQLEGNIDLHEPYWIVED